MTKPGNAQLSPRSVGVKTISTKALFPNPHNPRLLFDKGPLDILTQSIRKVGILVPLTVYQEKKSRRHFILDGQRRWMCAKDVGLEEVPINQVNEPTLIQNIVTMFQIHGLREDWELMPTALKLEVLMKAMKEKNERKLAELTRLDQAVVSRCKKLLLYSKKYQELMLDPDPNQRVKADFFIEMHAVRNDRNVSKMSWFAPEKFTKTMLDKYVNKKSGFKAVTDFRIMKQHITNAFKARKGKEITMRLKEYLESDSLSLDHLTLKGAEVSAHARVLLRAAEVLEAGIARLNAEEYYGEDKLWKTLARLMQLIKDKLTAAGRRIPK